MLEDGFSNLDRKILLALVLYWCRPELHDCCKQNYHLDHAVAIADQIQVLRESPLLQL